MYATLATSELRWPLAAGLHALAARVESDEEQSAVSQVNGWLAKAQWRGPDSVLEAVRRWQTEDLPWRFALARTILLKEHDAAISMVPEVLLSGELTRDDLRTWPLFEQLRVLPNFARLLTE